LIRARDSDWRCLRGRSSGTGRRGCVATGNQGNCHKTDRKNEAEPHHVLQLPERFYRSLHGAVPTLQ
jgi:hypothetical protein